MRNTQGSISYLARLFAEYRAEKSFLGGKLGFYLRSNLTYKYISRGNLGAYAYNSAFVEVLKGVLSDVRNISCDFLGP